VDGFFSVVLTAEFFKTYHCIVKYSSHGFAILMPSIAAAYTERRSAPSPQVNNFGVDCSLSCVITCDVDRRRR